ncbi:MAG: gliding motility-associated C-terminal domain-containing protein [Sphingobacteriaceae bacterium]|nr:gliding motility-associated C-terminal domain-containing protein [Sphingobacteriaceae bacterium]
MYCNFSLGLSSIADYSSCVDKDTDGDGLVDRLDIESDGDGVTDAQELADGTDYTDPCSFVLANQTLTPDAAWNAADCDADGDTNETEKTNGTNPLVFDTLPQITGPDGTGTTTAATSALDYAENATTSIYTFTSNRSVTWSLDGGEDSAKFSINATSGALTFASSPDFETPTDGSVSGSNTYTVVIKAVDNRNLGNRQTLTVTITNVNEAPSITSIAPQSVLGTDPTSDLAFTVSDPESEAANLIVSVASSNTTLVPTSNIVVTGTGANRTVRVSAADGLYGTANITLTVTDELGLSTSTTFALTIQNASCNTFTVSDFQLNGNSSVAGNIITLTPNAGAQSGSAWNKNKLILSEDFNISAKVYLGNNDAGADGIAFVLQNQSVNAGSSGGGLGYSGITPSFAVEFDTYYNGVNDPGSQDHIAIIKNGQTSSAAAHSEFATPYYVQMEDGQWHDVQFIWTAQTKNFQVWYDGTKRFDIVYDIKANIFPSQNYAYWGFTGATGGAINLQQVQIPEYCYAKQATITPTAGTNNASGATTFCYGSDVVLQASTATSYQWYKNGALISGANLREFTASQTGSYTVEVVSTRGGITSVSEPTIVAVNPVPVIFYAQPSYSFIRGNVLSPIVVSNTGAGSTNFTISPSLPAGLSFNASNGTISGTPTAISNVQNYTVSASSAAACQASTVVSIRVYNDNPPANLTYTPSTQTLRRNTPMNNMVPTATGGAVISYSISPNLPAGLSINPTTGVISGTLTAALTGSQTYTVTATNSGGSTTATITLIFNSPPTDIIPSSSSIAENNAIGAVIGRLSSTDVDLGDTHTYRLVAGTGSTDNARFSIVGNELKALISFNFENKTSYTIRIRTTDAGGLSFEKAISIAITNVNEVPTDWAISASNINENNAIGAVIGNLSTTDVDAGDTFTYRLVSGTGSTDNGKFTIVGNELKADISFNFEAKKTYSVRIRTTDAGGLSFEKVITIGINDVNEAPTNITLSRSYIYESNEIGVDIGVLNTADVDARDTHRYSLVGGDVNAFSILDNQLKAAISYNSANKNTYSVVLRTTDLGGLSFDKTFTITILKTPVVTGTGNITGSLVRTAPSSNPSISKGLTSQLNVAGMAIVNYRWSPSLSLSANNIANPLASPAKTTTYTVTVTHSSGAVCTLTIPVLVLNDYNVTPGNIITPNGDGINDAWVVENLESYPENEVKIFDKAGRLIYGKKGYTNDWRAEVNGSLLTEDTYYYFISFGPGVPVKKGFITIIRN